MFEFYSGYFKFPNGECHFVDTDGRNLFVDNKKYDILTNKANGLECIFYDSKFLYCSDIELGISPNVLYNVKGRNGFSVGTCKVIEKDGEMYKMKINLNSGITFIYERKRPNTFGFCDIDDLNFRIDFTKIKDE